MGGFCLVGLSRFNTLFHNLETGSGKTYTMGTSFDINLLPEEDGIIPRAVSHLFKQIENRKSSANHQHSPATEFQVYAQFMELYNEEIIDLFDPYHHHNHNSNTNGTVDSNNNNNSNNVLVPFGSSSNSSKSQRQKIEIHEDGHGNVYVNGCTFRAVTSANDVIINFLFLFVSTHLSMESSSERGLDDTCACVY